MKGWGQKELKFQDEFSYVDSTTTRDCQFTQKANASVTVGGGGGGGLNCIHSFLFLFTGPMTKEMSHMLSSLQVSYCRETKMSIVSIQVVSLRTQAVKLHKNFDHFRYSLRENKKKTFGVYILPSLSQVLETINLHLY